MRSKIEGRPAFARLELELAPGESVVAEADAMASMTPDLGFKAELAGGIFTALARRLAGGESMFVNRFANATSAPQRVCLVQTAPGDIQELELKGDAICLQPGAFLASTPGVRLGVEWAGFKSLIAREGLFRLRASGAGTLWYASYGAIVERELDGQMIVDSGHLVAYDPSIELHIQLAGGGILSSLFSGEGFVTRLVGRGRVTLQTRSLGGLAAWLNPFLY